MVVVVYCDMEDAEAARLIADTLGYELSHIPTAEADPLTQHTDVDIIAVGGPYPNIFNRYYFAGGEIIPEKIWDSVLNPENFPDNPEMWRLSQRYNFGVSPDGKRHTQTIVRENGTKVTGIMGVHAEDGLEAANRYVLPSFPVVAAALPLGGITPAMAVWASRGKK